MTKTFIITSCIETTNSPLTYSAIRSVFTPDERLRQTVTTINSIDLVSDPDTKIYLLDMSEHWEPYRDFFSYQPNLEFISVKSEFPDIFSEVTNHANKSRCESYATLCFLERYQTQLRNSEYLIKISGRYFFDRSFDLDDLSSNHIFFKQAWRFPWQDWWNYDAVRLSNDPVLHQYCSVLFAWNSQQWHKVIDLYQNISLTLTRPDWQHYDLETLLYFYSRKYQESIKEMPWTVYGWLAPNGRFVKQ